MLFGDWELMFTPSQPSPSREGALPNFYIIEDRNFNSPLPDLHQQGKGST